jgi:hypothetical protein
MELRSEPTNTVWSFPFTPQAGEQTPLAVQAYLRTMRDELKWLYSSGHTEPRAIVTLERCVR